MKTIRIATVNFKAITLVGLCCLLSNFVFAQSPSVSVNTDQYYLLREYTKVEPGKRAEYVKTEQLWKKVHQRRLAEGKIIDWTLYRCVFPSGSNAAYDYMTVTVFKSGKEMQDASNFSWDYIIKGMTKEEEMIADNTEKIRKIVSSNLFHVLERVQPQPNTNFTQITTLKAETGKGAELEKLETMMKPVFEEAVKMGSISGWRFGEQIYPITPESGDFYRVIGTTNLDQMLKAGNSNYIETAFKKIYPEKNYAATMKIFRDMISIKDVELWEKVDSTN
jgi:hypothetical protein